MQQDMNAKYENEQEAWSQLLERYEMERKQVLQEKQGLQGQLQALTEARSLAQTKAEALVAWQQPERVRQMLDVTPTLATCK